jgi:hypothetical protein
MSPSVVAQMVGWRRLPDAPLSTVARNAAAAGETFGQPWIFRPREGDHIPAWLDRRPSA